MIPSDRRPNEPTEEAEPKRATLPPPEWTAPRVAGHRTDRFAAQTLPRRVGARAEEAWMRARVEEARAAGDNAALRTAAATLARWLASRDRDLDEAVELAATALHIEEDVELRREVAAWLESLGEASRAASALRPIASMPDVEPAEAAYILVRTGVLKARAGAAAAAAAAFEQAAPIDGGDALPAELLGALSAWQPDAVPPSAAADAYVEAARRRAAQRRDDSAIEDLWRAFAIDPSSGVAAEALAEALVRRGKGAAADEAWRAHARALERARIRDESTPDLVAGARSKPDGASAAAAAAGVDVPSGLGVIFHDGLTAAERVHSRRREAGLDAGDLPRALAAALDQGLDGALEGEGSDAFDALLLDLGMHEAVAARLEARAARSVGATRANQLAELARLCAGPLANPQRALSACVAGLAADPSSEQVFSELRARLGGPEADEPLRVVAASITGIADESERRTRLVERLGRAMGQARGAEIGSVVPLPPPSEVGDASSLEQFAWSASPSVRGVLFAVASDRHLAAGDRRAARRAAELATQADPGSARCVSALADAVVGEHDRPAAAALERAISIVGPRVKWCLAIADALEALGEADLAVGWSQRCVALRPGDREATGKLLERLLRAGDAGRLGDSLAWLLSQPQPVSWLADPFSRALRELARLDVDRAAVVARRALDVFGPKAAPLRDAMLEVATRASDDGFAAAILERWLSCGVEGSDRRALFPRLADLRERLSDEEGEARIVARAVREGVTSPEMDRHVERLADRPATPDAQLWRLRARAERLSGGGGTDGDPEEAAWAWRDLGAALWDLADDRVGAISAWQRAARLSPHRGHATFALDLVAFADTTFAFGYLAQLVETEPDDLGAATIAADVARAALAIGQHDLAFDMAARGLARSPACADALAVAEKAAEHTKQDAALSALYDLVAERALGRFGRRAAHYRGARFFERRGQNGLALKHAAQAFYAVPTEGSSFQLLARAAERAGDRTHAVKTLEQVAERADQSAARAGWLLRAASLAGGGEDGSRRKVDVLLRAAVAAPSVATIALLREAAQDLLRFGPEERDALEMRLARAARSIGARLDGPEGARVEIAFAETALELFGDADGAFDSIERAFACDADIDEYESLRKHATALAAAPNAAQRVAALLDASAQQHTNVGIAVLRLLAAVASSLGDVALRARAYVAAAVREPDEDDLVIEADAAVRAVPALAARLSKRVPKGRRSEALLTAARSRVVDGNHADAAGLFERALDLVEGSAQKEVVRELHASWEAAGRSSEIEARVQREAASDTASPAMRADRWTEVSERREARGDRKGAVRALQEACKLDAGPLERWSALERVAESAGDDDARVAALGQIVKRVKTDGRVAVFKRLARAQERRGDKEAAEQAWHEVLRIDPDDEEADHAIEALIVARARYDQLVEHLARRAERLVGQSGTREILRAVRLRRAAILEQRLGRLDDACIELERLLAEAPDNSGALRYLADLLERTGAHARAMPLWRRAAAVETDPDARDELELRTARSARTAGDLSTALDHANRVLARRPTSQEALTLRVDLARALGLDADLGDALEALARADTIDARTRSELMVQAAQAAARAGDPDRALDRARRAAAAAPDRATSQLLARGLEYRLRGAGAPDEARTTIEELGRVREQMTPDDDALRAFLVAEALDVVQGGNAGQRELEATRAIVGDHALLALGLAERLAAQGHPAAAVAPYHQALAGTLLDLRQTGVVALAAADTAVRAGQMEDALAFLAVAEQHDESRIAASARRARLAEREAAARRSTPTPEPADGSRASAAAGTGRPSLPSTPTDPYLEQLETAVRTAATTAERARARLTLARARIERGDARGAEPLLWEALADGLAEAGDVLAPVIASASDRSRDLVRVRRQQVALEPGDIGRIESLRAAALADDDRVYARAVEHVLRAFDPGAGPLPPPSLTAQPEQPGIFALLARPSRDAAGEALALLWEGALQLFVRDPSSYGITGVERVVAGATSAIARLYEVAMRVLDAPRIPLFVPRSSVGAPLSHVALLAPPSVVLAGDVREETPELRFALGRGMSAALPQNVLRLGLAPGEGRTLLDALRTAFGPAELGRRVDPKAARMAESFWQIVPARTQRRLQEILGSAQIPEHDELVARAQQSGRRVGMFLAGDFGWAARTVLAEAPTRAETPLSLTTLRPLCVQVPALADLLRLAISPEYADARWHPVADSSPRGSLSSGRFSIF
jgi:tetratricopeptide (TPR) repeat protein